MQSDSREVTFAVGFTDHTWVEVTIEVPQSEDRWLDDDEVIEHAKRVLEQVGFEPKAVSFYHMIFISPLDGVDD